MSFPGLSDDRQTDSRPTTMMYIGTALERRDMTLFEILLSQKAEGTGNCDKTQLRILVS
jgi:hypothetical protein